MLVACYLITVILTKELVMAGEYHFQSPLYPADSCADIYNKYPNTHGWAGYYWILHQPRELFCGMPYTGSSCENIYKNHPETGDKSGYYRINDKWTYCSMKDIAAPKCPGTGGWRNIANIDISAGDDCPSGWRKGTHNGVSFCRVDSDDSNPGCFSAFFSTNGTSYSRVFGRTRGYQKAHTNAFAGYLTGSHKTVNGHYADGLLLSYGNPHRSHIWTYVAGRHDDKKTGCCDCPCAFGGQVPNFVGNHYYCEAGNINTVISNSDYYFDDPLWDGSDCHSSTKCCSHPTLPWFYRELSESTTSDIEARLCVVFNAFEHGSVLIDQLELYVQ